MSNKELSKQEIVSAHEAMDELNKRALRHHAYYGDNSFLDLLETVSKALPTKPQITMYDVDWEHDKHFLAVAEDTRDKQRLIMLFPEVNGLIRCINGEGLRSYTEAILREYLVPTGERYTLVDTQE